MHVKQLSSKCSDTRPLRAVGDRRPSIKTLTEFEGRTVSCYSPRFSIYLAIESDIKFSGPYSNIRPAKLTSHDVRTERYNKKLL